MLARDVIKQYIKDELQNQVIVYYEKGGLYWPMKKGEKIPKDLKCAFIRVNTP